MRRRELVVGACLLGAVAITAAKTAWAGFNATTPAQALTVATLTVAPATGLAVTTSCGPVGSASATVSLTWTGTTTTRATSYTVRRKTTGLYSDVAQVPIGTTSGSDTGLLTATTYTYLVRTNLNSWYADSATASVTTPVLCP